ncbi:MAG: UDP-N-acetylmuramoylalanine--D-glutamate ligase [Candidatus Chisholmbacteria bacterium RIFCSPHIGHO2_01_FULL_48_12]|uniref:UDP-N-acetylmuramoylalanine--D-glutamate ligase n=1 Tax=Candidatus Chisholmbacteria bacterium RIFCSPHIGHO2_01_FULL_48_12 TaxID=1797589 RepID=A0A1G1VQ38_9BACT|nr:MAG: UDP-N-acetylmuramoylalanine--D-glutamate ligase [Candidatus Chisholmbacteria bacterium RIFCSPHIGHO2_01_FULL_48_12]
MTPWHKFKLDWAGKRVLIMGLGLQGGGVGAAKIFAKAQAKVTVTDLKSADQLQSPLDQLKGLAINFVLGEHRQPDFLTTDLILRNPDVNYHHPLLKLARSKHIPIAMDASIFARYCSLPIIGVTGTRGKTTTATMIYEILEQLSGLPVFLAGNIPGTATLELLSQLENKGLVVLELSSWALQGWHDAKVSPHIAVFTNFYEDHLNRYASMEEYFQDKLAITQYQQPTDWLVVNQQLKAITTHAQIRQFSTADWPADIKLAIPGPHNRANAAAALAVTDALGLNHNQALKIIAAFPGVPYRLETVATINGISFINDTTATTPTATIAALKAVDRPVWLIAGGNDKNLDFSQLGQVVSQRVKGVFLLQGSATPKLIQAIKIAGGGELIEDQYGKLQSAVTAAFKQAQPGDVILLSPAATSFGMFVNEFDRGRQFNTLVKSLQ